MEIIVYLNLKGNFIPAGRLLFKEDKSFFAYGKKYLTQDSSIAIDPIELPLIEKEFQTQEDFNIFNVIRDAGPDNWGRYLLAKKFGRDLNELEYILASGVNRVGALAFGPDLSGPKILGISGFENYEGKDFDLDFCLSATEDFIANEQTARLKEYLHYGPSLGGARPKAAILYQGDHYLAKFSVSFDTRNEALIEYAAMRLAKKCGLNVPQILTLKTLNRDVFLIKRFDRISKNDFVPFFSGLTATGLHEGDYLSWSYAHLVQAIAKLSPHPEKDRIELFKRMIFNVLINNDDDHMRNHGFLHVSDNKWRLSPLYDVVPRSQKTSTFRSAMHIGTYGKEASMRNVLSACDYFGLEQKTAKEIWQELEQKVVSNWKKVFSDSGLNKKEIEIFEHCIGTK